MSKRLVIRQGRVHAIYTENDERGWPQEPFEVVSDETAVTVGDVYSNGVIVPLGTIDPLVAQKCAVTTAAGSTSGPTTTSGTFVLMPEMTLTVLCTSRPLAVAFSGSFMIDASLTSGDSVELAIYVDGVQQAQTIRRESSDPSLSALVNVATIRSLSCAALVTGLSVGNHTVECRWRRPGSTGAARCYTTQRSLIATEVGR